MAEPADKLIQYIGKKAKKVDTVTGSRPRLIWSKGEVLSVPVDAANRLLQFPDVWREVQNENGAIVHAVEAGNPEEVQTVQVTDAEILKMEEAELRDFVKEYGLKTRFQKNDDVHLMRKRVMNALEQEA